LIVIDLNRTTTAAALSIVMMVLLLASCGGQPQQAAGGGGSRRGCARANLPLLSAGRLTIATDKPAYPPWFVNNEPSNGRGFESAVAYAVAKSMGFGKGEVAWVVEPFNKSYAPGPKDFDFDINQISITPQREKVVDFSDGYYDVNQALVALKDSPIAAETSLEPVRGYKLGAQVGTTSYGYITQQIKPEQSPFAYDTTNDAKSALQARQIDGIVVDLPTAFYISAAQIPGSAVVGQFPSVGQPEQFGLLLEQGNSLRGCVNRAINELRSDGTLASLQKKWLSQKVDAPVLK
jgi:polar amino acid transport system substrate-binding protein